MVGLIMAEVLWKAKPYMRKTAVKGIMVFLISLLIYSAMFYFTGTKFGLLTAQTSGFSLFLSLVGILFYAIAGSYFVFYCLDKRAFTFCLTDKSVHISKSWVFGTYERELTLDQIVDIHVNQGFLARLFKCGSLLFVSTAGLEVGYSHAGLGVGLGAGVLVGVGTGKSVPKLVSGKENRFWDVLDPLAVRTMLKEKIVQWRGLTQEKRVADSVEKIAEKMPVRRQSKDYSLADELERLNVLFEKGALDKIEFEKAKKKLLD
jgi:hypothetical protein